MDEPFRSLIARPTLIAEAIDVAANVLQRDALFIIRTATREDTVLNASSGECLRGGLDHSRDAPKPEVIVNDGDSHLSPLA